MRPVTQTLTFTILSKNKDSKSLAYKEALQAMMRIMSTRWRYQRIAVDMNRGMSLHLRAIFVDCQIKQHYHTGRSKWDFCRPHPLHNKLESLSKPSLTISYNSWALASASSRASVNDTNLIRSASYSPPGIRSLSWVYILNLSAPLKY